MIERMKSLIYELNDASDAYYNGDCPKMSDAEWDSLFDELKELEKEFCIILSNSPTQNVGYEVRSEFTKVKHEVPMLSLDKTKSVTDLQDFAKGRPCVLSLKMDGLSLRLVYQDGELHRAETRGNGDIGEDVTHNAKTIKNIPLSIPYKGKYVIDGECIIRYYDFDDINANLPEDQKYKNPRNLVSGSIRQLDSKVASERHMQFVAWKVVEGDDSNSLYLRLCNAYYNGFTVVPCFLSDDSKVINEKVIDMLRERAREGSYPIDGLVLAHDDIKYGNSLGRTGHHERNAIAFKFGEDEETTTLTDIEWSLGKTGELTPVAIFDTVELAGTEVSRASLHNISIMKNLYPGVWHKGMELVIKKSNEIIPYVVSANATVMTGEELDYPKICPVCGEPTAIHNENGSEKLYCDNPRCKGKLLGLFKTFVGRDYMNIDGLSEKTLEAMIDRNMISQFADLYHLSASDLKKLPGFGAKKVKNTLEAIDKSRETTLDRFIASLSIPLVSRSAGKIIATNFSTEHFFTEWKMGYRWSSLEGIGEKMEESLKAYADSHWNEIVELVEEINIKDKEESAATGGADLECKTFVITGKLEHFKNRKELENLITESGGKVSGSVSKNTFALINNDIESNSGKNKKAKELGIPIWSESELINFINK